MGYKETLAWRKANPEKFREQKRREATRWRAKYPEKARARRAMYRQRLMSRDPERAKQIKREQRLRYRALHPDARQRWKFSERAAQYGLTGLELAEMIEARGPNCPACGELSKPVIDHCHKDGYVRGLPCDRCNRALGYARDNPDTLRALAAYIEKARLFS